MAVAPPTPSSSTLVSATEAALVTLAPPPESASQLIKDTCLAHPDKVLTTAFARSVFKLAKDATGTTTIGVAFPPAPASTDASTELDLLALGVSALHAYAQVNWTGPTLPLDPLALFGDEERDGAGWNETQLNDSAIDNLAYCGEPAYHLAKKSTFLLLALQIFGLVPSPFATDAGVRTVGGNDWTLESIKVWRLRAGIMWIKVLDEPVPLPPTIPADAVELRNRLPSDSPIRPHLSLSLSILATILSRTSPHSSAQKEASNLAREAAKEVGLEWSLTGRMGKRTKWQIDEKTQLVVLARDRSEQKPKEEKKEGDGYKVPEVFALNDDTLLESTAFTEQATPSTSEDTSLESLDPSDQPTVSAFSQSVLLSLSIATLPHPTSLLHLHADVLSTSQVSAFVARVLADPKNWSVTSMALLLRCRGEAGRSRTVERGVLQMQALVDQLKDGSPTEVSAISSAVKEEDMAEARDRLECFHALNIPPAWEMERELATRYLSLGISKSALEIFERLEMWEEVAKCWVSLERPEKGVAVIKDLLSGGRAESDLVMDGRKGGNVFRGGEKREAKLWCTLGELENDPKHYEKAWEVSKGTSSRAQRSLGAVYWKTNDWDKATIALRLALKINPLFPRTWFVLGCCEMRVQNWAGAQEAFGRCVGLEEEDAESWSNLASCHLRRGEIEGDVDEEEDEEKIEEGVDSTGVVGATSAKEKEDKDGDEAAVERLPFSRKRAAYHCLRQAIKYSYESWRMWFNYMVVAVDVGELSEACRALGRIVEMRATKDGESAIDLEVLERLVDAVTRDQGGDEEDEQGKPYIDPNVGKGLAPRVEDLITKTIVPRISNSPRVFLAHARLLFWSADYAGALDAHLKAYRVGVATDATVEHDKQKFKDAAERVEEVVGMLENLGPKDGKDGKEVAPDWKYQARSLVRTFLGRTKESFEDEPEFEKLKELVAELR
ncbi:TPR repeat containing protein [Pseudohyphozyma bogoriensis]|nr:TPR repeat containing protein [Pseudohyphozyma bogoriensis]